MMIKMSETKEVEVGEMQIHPELRDFVGSVSYSLVTENITSSIVKTVLVTQPIILIAEKNKLYCIGGFRTFLLSKTNFPPDMEIPTTLIRLSNNSKKGIFDFAMADSFIKHFLHSLARPELVELRNLYSSIEKQRIEELAPQCATQVGFAKLVNKSRQKLFDKTTGKNNRDG